MRKKENNYAFIDSQNLNLSIRALGWKLDFRRFRIYLRYMNDLEDMLAYNNIIKRKDPARTEPRRATFPLVILDMIRDQNKKSMTRV